MSNLYQKVKRGEEITIDDVSPSDRVNGYPEDVPRWYSKLFESIPAIITWGTLLSPVYLSLLGLEEWFIYLMSFYTVYWTMRALVFMLGVVISYRKYKKAKDVDWVKKIEEENLDDGETRFLLVYPVYRESVEETIRPAMEAWADSDLGADRLDIIFAFEKKVGEESREKFEQMKKEFGDRFGRMKAYYHPNDIEGEVQGVKTGNINWATRLFVGELEEKGIPLDKYMLITCDSDLRPHKKFLSSVLYKYFTVDKPKNTAYVTALHTFANNLWRVPALIRVMSQFITLAIMYRWGMRNKNGNETFSAYVVNLETVKKVKYWDPQLENDDTAFFYNALARLDGDFKTEVVYIPTYNDAVENETMVKSYKSLWMQQVRWGWGAVIVPMTWTTVYSRRKKKLMPARTVAYIFRKVFDEKLIFRTVIYLITLGPVVVAWLSPEYRYSAASVNLPRIMSWLLSSAFFFNIPIVIIRRRVVPIPEDWSLWRNLQDILETYLVTIVLLTFGFMPATKAQIEMMFRKGPKTEHYVTDKVQIKGS